MNTTFLFLLIILVGTGTYFLMKPFLVAVLVAFVISQLFKGWYLRAKRALRSKSLGSLATCFVIILLIFVPLFIVSGLIVAEANQLFRTIQENGIQEKILSASLNIPLLNLNISNAELQSIIGTDQFAQGLKNTGVFLLELARTTYQQTSNFLFMTLVMFFSLYYFFKDGDKLLKKMMELSPLRNSQEKLLVEKFISISRATLKGTLVIAIVQGLMTAILFWATGVKSPVLWGLGAAIVSLIPLIGPVLIWLPVGIVMILLGFVWQGIVILAIGGLVISLVDNFLRPALVSGDTSLHPLLVFLSTLGGLAMFGLPGFLLGPVIIVLFVTLLHIYQIEFRQDLDSFNK